MGTLGKAFRTSILIAAAISTQLMGTTLHGPQTFDADDSADLSVYNYGDGFWDTFKYEGRVPERKQWGWSSGGIIPVPADYDGDGIVDLAVYSQKNQKWYIDQSSFSPENPDRMRTSDYAPEDSVPVPHDYDGDGVIDLALYNPKDGIWYIDQSRDGHVTVPFGGKNLVPVPGYYDNTNRLNIAVYDYTKGRWYIKRNDPAIREDPFYTEDWGWRNLQAIPADYDGDGFTDLAVYNDDTGRWYIRQSASSNAMRFVQFGWNGTAPVPDDYDGDGVIDIALYKRSNGMWYIEQSSALRLSGTASPVRSENWGSRDKYPTHLQYQVTRWFHAIASKMDHLPIIYPENFNGTLWKTPNHSGDGTVVLLSSAYMADYQAGLFAGMVVSSDPAGMNIVGGSLGIGRIVAPYHERPAIRFDAVGTYYGSSPVYMVLIYTDGRRQPWYIPNPGVRTE